MMHQGIQSGFPHMVIRNNGCYFLTLLKWLEMKDGMSFNNEQIIHIFNVVASAMFIDRPNAFVRHPVEIVNFALGRRKYTRLIRDISARPNELCIVALTRPQDNGTHFILQEANGTTWDSLNPARPAAATWRPSSYRLLV